MLQLGDLLPHFDVTTIGGDAFSYSTVWQRRNVVLVVLPDAEPESDEGYTSQVLARTSEFTATGAECVVTRDPVPGVRGPAVLVADRWGEIVHVATATHADGLTSPQELLDWVEYLGTRCPECEGEAK